ncbi:MAG: aconitate hydratase AcnA [Deltaproteobacteria bacterium]|nr:aconitate hydratase AcnA [Deltaproteobacteria bacterium]
MACQDTYKTRSELTVGSKKYAYFSLKKLDAAGFQTSLLPFSLKILLENLLRHEDGVSVSARDIEALARWKPGAKIEKEISFMPARVLLQDFTGVPCVADLAAMRDALGNLKKENVGRINPLIPAELVIDHSVQVDAYGSSQAFGINAKKEFERNQERYAFLRWGQKAFANFKVVPPDTGIVHQVNLEYLARVVFCQDDNLIYPDTVIGTDSHTTMVNGLGVLGWGVGGIEAEAAMLGQPTGFLVPPVIGMKLSGTLPEGATATDLVLTITELLRQKKVVGKFVEFFGPGVAGLGLADRATISNMAPEFGCTCALFPVDSETLNYLRLTGRDDERVELVKAYCEAQGFFGGSEAEYTEVIELNLADVVPSLAGPKRPQDRIPLNKSKENFRELLKTIEGGKKAGELSHGSVVIAAITSCTNTSNPNVLIGAGLLARKAREKGLKVKPWVKTSLAPGSKVVTAYLKETGLLEDLEAMNFHLVGYGCTTCLAEGTPVLLANGTSVPIERLPEDGGSVVFGPTGDGSLGMARQTRLIRQGKRDCITLVLQDGRELVCTPDHEILTAERQWVRADQLEPGRDRLVVGFDAPVDNPSADESGYALRAGLMILTLDSPAQRARTLAFARLLGYLLGDGSISTWGQGRITVGQAVDREAVLNDIELVTGKRPAGTRYDEVKWSIVLPNELAQAFSSLPGVPVGRRINQTPTLPEFVCDEACPVSVVREFLGGLFGADGTAPTLHKYSDSASFNQPEYSQAAKPEDVAALKRVMAQVIDLLARCHVDIAGTRVYDYPVRRSASTYPRPQDGSERVEVRLCLANGLSFIEHVGYRYCADKALRASAAATYWRMIDRIRQQRAWMVMRLQVLKRENVNLSFREAREAAAHGLRERETIIFAHYSLLQGNDRFDRLPGDMQFKPLHRDACGFPSPSEFLEQIGARHWFSAMDGKGGPRRYCAKKNSTTLPVFTLGLLERRPAGLREVFDLTVSDLHAFVAGTVAVHNCIGNSGPLPEEVSVEVKKNNLTVAAVLSGNRNFEGRINPQVRANYLASPPLVVAYALHGHMDWDPYSEPIGRGKSGDVFLKDIWPTQKEIAATVTASVKPEMFRKEYAQVFEGDEVWKTLPIPQGDHFNWTGHSTYIQKPPFFDGMKATPEKIQDFSGTRVLVMLGDSVTTDHISPAGSIGQDSPAGKYLIAEGVDPKDFNSYGARRGNHEVMVRGTFANVRLKNELVPGIEGGVTRHLPSDKQTSIFEASLQYQKEKVPLIVIAGKEYGSGSSRDWAAKGPQMLGIRAIIAESYERIHRSNLIGMGILPLEFEEGQTRQSLKLTGEEIYSMTGIAPDLAPGKKIFVAATDEKGKQKKFIVLCRIDTPLELEYYCHGGILPYVLRQFL